MWIVYVCTELRLITKIGYKIIKAKRSCGIADYWKTILDTSSTLVLKSDNFDNIGLVGYEKVSYWQELDLVDDAKLLSL